MFTVQCSLFICGQGQDSLLLRKHDLKPRDIRLPSATDFLHPKFVRPGEKEIRVNDVCEFALVVRQETQTREFRSVGSLQMRNNIRLWTEAGPGHRNVATIRNLVAGKFDRWVCLRTHS